MAVEEKGPVCQAGNARRDIWELACPRFPGSDARCVLSLLCKHRWEPHGLGLTQQRGHTQKSIRCLGFLPWLFHVFLLGRMSGGEGRGAGGASAEVAAG